MVESPALFSCELSPVNIWLFVIQLIVWALSNDERVLSAYTKAILLKNKDLSTGHEKVGEERR